MTCKVLFLSLLLLIPNGSASAQIPPELIPFGLDNPNPEALRTKISKLARREQTEAVNALQTLAADTTLVTRTFNYYVTKRSKAGHKVNRKSEYNRAVQEVAKVRDNATRTARRLAFKRDTKIHCAFDLPDNALAMLSTQGAVVMPWTKNEMYEWYDDNYPFVTTDLVYHTFMILVRAAFDELETLSFKQELIALARDWSVACLALEGELDKDLQQLTRDNAAVLAVAAVLASDGQTAFLDDFGFSAARRSQVEAEVARVREATYIGSSPLLGQKEDYTEYRTRGRASGKEGADYFKARLWLSRATFPIRDHESTQRALLLTEALLRHQEAWSRWAMLDRITGQLAGPRDDPDVRMYRDLAEDITGLKGAAALRAVITDTDALTKFRNKAGRWPRPQIDDSRALGRDAIFGLRLLGQRRSSDGILLQRLSEGASWPISGLQVMTGLFDIADEAAILAAAGLKLPAGAAMVEADTIGLMSGFRSCHEVLFDTPVGLPDLFRSPQWRDKQINSALGAWAESRHAAAPYLKSAHVYAGLSMPGPKLQGYVEPYPDFYRRLIDQVRTWDGLCRQVGVYDAVSLQAETDPKAHRLDEGRFLEFMEILDRLAEMAENELQGEPQTDEEANFLKSLGTRLRHLCFNHSSMNISEEPMSRIIDVATEYQSGQVLEAGVGMAHAIFVAVTHGDETVVCRGSVYGYHEFVVPLQSRLDDTVWAGISAGTVVLGRGPWLSDHSRIYYQPQVSSAELEAFLAVPPGPHLGGRRVPWFTKIDDHSPVAPWVGVHVGTGDIGFLISMADQKDLSPELARFVYRELSRHGQRRQVLEFWRGVIDDIVEQGALRGGFQYDVIRLFWALQVLAEHGGAQDGARLAGIEKIINQSNWQMMSSRGEPRDPGLRWALGVAVSRCAVGVSIAPH